MSKIYYRYIWEGMKDDGYYYAEVIDHVTQRQIVEIGDNLYWSTLQDEKDECYGFTDQPEFPQEEFEDSKNDPDFLILSENAFNELWTKANAT